MNKRTIQFRLTIFFFIFKNNCFRKILTFKNLHEASKRFKVSRSEMATKHNASCVANLFRQLCIGYKCFKINFYIIAGYRLCWGTNVHRNIRPLIIEQSIFAVQTWTMILNNSAIILKIQRASPIQSWF